MSNSIFKRLDYQTTVVCQFYALIKADRVTNYCPTYFDSLNPDINFIVQSLTDAPKVPTLYVKTEGLNTHITTKTSKESFETLHKLMTVARFMDQENGLDALYNLLKPSVAGDLEEFFNNNDKETVLDGLIHFDNLPILIVRV
jgi:hypothetical protein